MNLYMIAKSNIKKNRSMMLTLAALIIFATILLYIGISVVLDMNTFLDDKNENLNGSDFAVLGPKKYQEDFADIFREKGDYNQLETVDTVKNAAVFKNITMDEKSQSMGCLILNADDKEEISRLKIIDRSEKKLPNSIILPYYLKVAKGYNTGDELNITIGNKILSYIVYGFAEDIMFATPSNISYYKCYVFDNEFQKIFNGNESSRYVLMKAKLIKGTDIALYNDVYLKKANDRMKDAASNLITMDYDSMKVGVSIFLIILMSVLIVFSLIILLIALTVMRFAIVTYIEGNMKNIGSMEALGYTGKELIRGLVLQFALITLLSIGIGLLIAVSCVGLFTNMISLSIGLAWNVGVNLLAIFINLTVIMLLVIMITYLAAAKLKKITPIIALRSGIETHNFRKNHLPLHKSPFNIGVSLGLKSLLQNMKQNIIILIIVSLMSFVCVFSFTTNYNFNVDNTAFLRLVGIEKSNLMVTYQKEDSIKLFDEISQMDHVRKTTRLMDYNLTVKYKDREITPLVKVCNDFSRLEIQTIVKGRYPVQDNEITVTGLVLDRLNAEIGDAIYLGENENEKEFIIVGVNQQIMNLGKGVCITEEGMERINPDFIPSQLYIYLKESTDIKAVKKAIEDKYNGLNLEVSNIEESFDTILESFNSAVIGLTIFCIVITLSIITLILYLLIRIKLLKEKLRIGVSKALGYTTRQLVFQIIVSFCPVCILGALIGTVMALFLINPAFAVMLSISGILNSHFVINPLLTLITFLGISMFSILISALVARSIKKITPCELFW